MMNLKDRFSFFFADSKSFHHLLGFDLIYKKYQRCPHRNSAIPQDKFQTWFEFSIVEVKFVFDKFWGCCDMKKKCWKTISLFATNNQNNRTLLWYNDQKSRRFPSLGIEVGWDIHTEIIASKITLVYWKLTAN